ncbi:MAG: helicase HerA-like domain-containing protein [Chitinophagales bacterium]
MNFGAAMLDGQAIPHTVVKAPLKTFNRHGLIAGATGTGKTKTLQVIAEQLSNNGVGVLLMDVKGDLSGLAKAGSPHAKIDERHDLMGEPWQAKEFPVELMTISDQDGLRLRATVSEFGPVLFSKILDCSEAQQGIVAIVFKYCDDNALPLLDLKDFRKALQYLTNEGKEEIESEYGRINSSSVSTIIRKLIELESQGAENFFGERSFDVEDLTRKNKNGDGYINILRLTDVQDKPKLFSTFMLCLLAEVYEKFPEEGDLEKPKLVIFIDEAHLIFQEASKALLSQIETIVKLIRSKGVGIFFCTQNPTDIPNDVLGQLGMKVQHALRAFTAKDRKAIKLVAENYPSSDYYEVNKTLTELGIGEAFITVLNEKGIPTPLVHTLLRAPSSRMDVITEQEKKDLIRSSDLASYYNEVIDRESAYEKLSEKIEKVHEQQEKEEAANAKEKSKSTTTRRTSTRAKKSTFDKIFNSTTTRQIGRTFTRELTRGLLGVLGVK